MINNQNNFTDSQSMYLPMVTNAVNTLASEISGKLKTAGGITSGIKSGTFTSGTKRTERLDTEEDNAAGSHNNNISLKLLELNQILKRREKKRLALNIPFIIMSGVVFIAVLAWFEVLRSFYDRSWELDPNPDRFNPSWERAGYAILVTLMSIILVYIFYKLYQVWFTDFEVTLD